MSCRVLQRRDLDLPFGDVCALAPQQEMGQLVYLSYGSTLLHLYIQRTYGELHQESISTSILIIFTTDFSLQNDLTTTISTKSHKTIEFSNLFVRQTTPQSQSSHTSQYLFEGMFMCYILQK